MLYKKVNLDKKMPKWAENYLDQDSLILLIELSRISGRLEMLGDRLKGSKHAYCLDVLEFKSNSTLVFKWNTAEEKTMFLLKWS